MNRTLLVSTLSVSLAVVTLAPAQPPLPGEEATPAATPTPEDVTSPVPRAYLLRVLDRSTGEPVPRCRVYRKGPGNESKPVGETGPNGELELPESGLSGQRLLALSLSYDPVDAACPLQGETILRARPTRYAAQNEEKAEIAAAAGDFATAAELSLQAARLAQREQQGIVRGPASDSPTPAATPTPAPAPGQPPERSFRRRPAPAPTAPPPIQRVNQAAQRYEQQAYEYAARSLRMDGPATLRRSDTGAVEPTPELRRRLEALQRRQRQPVTGRLEVGVPSQLPRE